MARGVRQGCPLSPTLFNLVLADLEEEMRKGKWGGMSIKEEKVYTLMYADDVVVLAEDEYGRKVLISRLERYLERKGLELNVQKTKIMRFRKGGGRKRKTDWRWKGKRLEEVKEFKYLGFTIKSNGGQEAHVNERRKKAAIVMREVWRIGKRMWGKDWERGLWLYDTLVWTVMGYGAEVWGWKERKEIEEVHDRFLRWTMGIDWRTPGYMIREELDRWMMRGRAGKRAWEFEKRLKEGRGGEIARRCWEEMTERWRKERIIGKWEQGRRAFFRERGIEEGEMGRVEYSVLEREGRQRQIRERWKKIRESRYNVWYKEIRREGISKYLMKGWSEERWKRIIRFRLGNEMKGSCYWEEEEEEKKVCRMCKIEEESWEHVWEECIRGIEWGRGSWQERIGWVLGEEGDGEDALTELEGARRERESRGGRIQKGRGKERTVEREWGER